MGWAGDEPEGGWNPGWETPPSPALPYYN